jgi:hypothetical protein
MKIKIRAQAKVKIKSFENADLSAIMFDVKLKVQVIITRELIGLPTAG